MKTGHSRPRDDDGRSPAAPRPDALTDVELLGFLLYPRRAKAGRERLADSLLQRFGGLRGLQAASRRTAAEREGLDDRAARLIRLSNELVRRQLRQSLERGVSLTSPAVTMEYLQTVLQDRNIGPHPNSSCRIRQAAAAPSGCTHYWC